MFNPIKRLLNRPVVIRQVLMGEIDEIEPSENSWSYRAYRWWQDHGGRNKSTYRENICHYVRVVLVWVPLFWLFKVPIYKWIRPWMIPAAILWGYAYQQFPSDRGSITTLGVEAIMYSFVGYSRRRSKQVIEWPFKFVWKHGLRAALSWFFGWHPARWVYPWSVILTVIWLIAFWLNSDAYGFWPVLIYQGGGTILFGIVVLGIIGLIRFGLHIADLHYERQLSRPERPYTYVAPQKQGDSSTKLALKYVLAKKRRICPFIRLPGQSSIVDQTK